MSRGGRAAVSAEAFCPRPRDSGDGAVGIHLADAVVARIGNVEVAGVVHRHAGGAPQLSRGGRAAVSAVALCPRPRDSGDDAVGGHLADAVVARIGNVEVAGVVHRRVRRKVQPCRGGRPPVS